MNTQLEHSPMVHPSETGYGGSAPHPDCAKTHFTEIGEKIMLPHTEPSTMVALEEITNPDMYWHLPAPDTHTQSESLAQRRRHRRAKQIAATTVSMAYVRGQVH